jgi:hypothetical protein
MSIINMSTNRLLVIVVYYREYQDSVAIDIEGTTRGDTMFRSKSLCKYYRRFRERIDLSSRTFYTVEKYLLTGFKMQQRYAVRALCMHSVDSIKTHLLLKGAQQVHVRIDNANEV